MVLKKISKLLKILFNILVLKLLDDILNYSIVNYTSFNYYIFNLIFSI